ncbi:MAG: 4Fe-4S dicluster domain-containing protein [Candidatus Helarchaeales archaeon]
MDKSIEIIVNSEKCSGCRTCQFICAFTFHETFALNLARIEIDDRDLYPKITFRDDCINCGTCAKYCVYGALSLKEEVA